MLSNCYDECNNVNETLTLRDTVSNGTFRLLCRETDSLIFKFSYSEKYYDETNSERQSNGVLYLLKLYEKNNLSQHRIIYIVSIIIVIFQIKDEKRKKNIQIYFY